MKNLAKQIAGSDLFFNIEQDEIENIINSINYKIIKLIKYEYIFDGFTDSEYIGLILSGNVNIEKILPCGKSVFMYSKKKGDIFGEVAAFSKAEHYPCNVISKTSSSLLIINKSEFLKMLTLNHNILQNFLSLVCNKTFSLNKRISTLSFTSAKEKIVYSLLNDFTIDENSCVRLPFNKQCWAGTLNISRASLYRELSILCSDSLIYFDKTDTIKILAINELQERITN